MNKSYVSYALYYTPSNTLLREYPYSNRKVKKLKLSENPHFVINRTNAYIVTMSEFCCIDNDENQFNPENMTFKVKENTDKTNRTVLVNCRYNYEEQGIYGPVNLETTAQVIWKYDSTEKTTRAGTKLLKHDIVFKIDPTTVDTLNAIRTACVDFIKENKDELFSTFGKKKMKEDDIDEFFNLKLREDTDRNTDEKYTTITTELMVPSADTPAEEVPDYMVADVLNVEGVSIEYNPALLQNRKSNVNLILEFPYIWMSGYQKFGIKNRISKMFITETRKTHNRKSLPKKWQKQVEDAKKEEVEDLPDDSEGEFEESD